ncbi:MAG: NUDIX domain-containing protein [Candidatus Aenigmarchaeota archaeon]|nr:NUDIX domain-containing protein [Candidatus Aenigmarchaeota archaeon]
MGIYVAVIGVVKFKDKIILLKRTLSRRTSPGKWQVVSGTLEAGEAAEDCVLREVKEETGLEGKIEKSGKIFECKDSWGNWIIIPFSVFVNSDKVKIEPKEHTEYRWVLPRDYVKFDCVEGTKEDLESVGVL